jgi:hypothetical protein
MYRFAWFVFMVAVLVGPATATVNDWHWSPRYAALISSNELMTSYNNGARTNAVTEYGSGDLWATTIATEDDNGILRTITPEFNNWAYQGEEYPNDAYYHSYNPCVALSSGYKHVLWFDDDGTDAYVVYCREDLTTVTSNWYVTDPVAVDASQSVEEEGHVALATFRDADDEDCVCALFWHSTDLDGTGAYFCLSVDNGENWDNPRRILTIGDPSNFRGASIVAVQSSDTVCVAVEHSNNRIYVAQSTDAGVTDLRINNGTMVRI